MKPLQIEQKPDGTVVIEGVRYAPTAFRFLAAPHTDCLYRLRRDGDVVSITEFRADDPLLEQALNFLARAEAQIDELQRDRAVALSLAGSHRAQAQEIARRAREAGIELSQPKAEGDGHQQAAAA